MAGLEVIQFYVAPDRARLQRLVAMFEFGALRREVTAVYRSPALGRLWNT
jgi:hypothetical protein